MFSNSNKWDSLLSQQRDFTCKHHRVTEDLNPRPAPSEFPQTASYLNPGVRCPPEGAQKQCRLPGVSRPPGPEHMGTVRPAQTWFMCPNRDRVLQAAIYFKNIKTADSTLSGHTGHTGLDPALKRVLQRSTRSSCRSCWVSMRSGVFRASWIQ